MVKKIAIGVVVLIAAVLGFAATRPDTFRVERAMRITAPPEKIFPLIEDFHSWGLWSPWEKKDPAMQRTYRGPERGVGSVYAWQGNSDIGKGSMRITAVTPPSRIVFALDFSEPFEAHNIAEFTLEPVGAGSEVTWAMHGPSTLMSKVIGLFLDMDGMVGADFETGLATLKSIAER